MDKPWVRALMVVVYIVIMALTVYAARLYVEAK